MKEYELVVLIHPDLEIDLEKPLNGVRDLVKSAGGEIVSEDNWGKKKLAYSVKGQNFAVYVVCDVKLPSDAPLKISNALNISDEVLRYLLTAVDLKGRKALEEAKAASEKEDQEEAKEEDKE